MCEKKKKKQDCFIFLNSTLEQQQQKFLTKETLNRKAKTNGEKKN